jgi:pimeloyl-ACP methyl ester carboxylesterase
MLSIGMTIDNHFLSLYCSQSIYFIFMKNALWVSHSPSLKKINLPLLNQLSRYTKLSNWEYFQSLDEAGDFDRAVALLSEHLDSCSDKIHLIGHGLSGTIALFYTRMRPEKVASLTLLSVGHQPAITWHAHYYQQLQLLPCNRQRVLENMARNLFGYRVNTCLQKFVELLEKDLLESPLGHSLFNLVNLPVGGVRVPLFVGGCTTDFAIGRTELSGWRKELKYGDLYWECDDGGHFFHYFHPGCVSHQVSRFWQLVELEDPHRKIPTANFAKM